MSRWPSLKQLHYLVSLAECQNFNRAAKSCFVSQSTLSAGIQSLEELLGSQLIERDHKSFIITPIGQEVVARARLLLSQTKDLLELTQTQGQGMYGSIRLGCIPTIAPFLLSQLLKLTSERYPELELLLREDTSANLLSRLEAGDLDILILALPYELRGLHSRVVGLDPFKLVVHRQLADKLSEPVEYGQLPDHSIFLLEQEHCLTGHAVSACQLADTRKINPFAATSLYTLIQMVSAQQGATFLPQMAINSGLLLQTDLIAIAPASELASREIGLVWRPSSTRGVTFNLLGELIGECVTICSRCQ